MKSGSHASARLEEATHRQHLLLTLLCHTGPPALHRFLFKKGHKPLRMESVIQQIQGALLGCLGRLGHVVKIQLQGACDRMGFFGGGFLNHRQPRPTLGLGGFQKKLSHLLSLYPWAWSQVKSLQHQLPIHGLFIHLYSFPPTYSHVHVPTNVSSLIRRNRTYPPLHCSPYCAGIHSFTH